MFVAATSSSGITNWVLIVYINKLMMIFSDPFCLFVFFFSLLLNAKKIWLSFDAKSSVYHVFWLFSHSEIKNIGKEIKKILLKQLERFPFKCVVFSWMTYCRSFVVSSFSWVLQLNSAQIASEIQSMLGFRNSRFLWYEELHSNLKIRES